MNKISQIPELPCDKSNVRNFDCNDVQRTVITPLNEAFKEIDKASININNAKISAVASALTASLSKEEAVRAKEETEAIKNSIVPVTYRTITLPAGQDAKVEYDAVSAIVTFSIPKGLAGDGTGDMLKSEEGLVKTFSQATNIPKNQRRNIDLSQGENGVWTAQKNDKIPINTKWSLFHGNLKMLSDSTNNILEKHRFSDTEAYYIGKINTGIAKFKKPDGRPLKICLVGDSISLGSDFSSHRVMPGQLRQRGQMLDSTMGLYSDHLVKGLLAKNIKFDFYNRSIGGYSLGNMNNVISALPHEWNGREFVDTAKTWYQNIEAIQPDILIIAHGMNNASESNNFMPTLIDQLYNPAKAAGWLNAEKMILLTVPNPAWNDTDNYGEFTSFWRNGNKLMQQIQQRAWCRDNGVYCVDIGFLQTLYRYGISTKEKAAFKKNTQFVSRAGSGAGVGGTGQITLNSEMLHAHFDTNDKGLEGQVEYDIELHPNHLTTANSILSIYPMKETIVRISGTRIQIYNGIKIGGAGYKFKELDYVLEKTSFRIKIDYNEYAIQVYIDNVCVGNMPNPNIGQWWHQVDISGAKLDAKITPVALFNVWYGQYKNVLTSDQIWNESGGSNWSGLPYGGGINHPNILGLGNVYLPSVTELLTDLEITEVGKNIPRYFKVDKDGSRTVHIRLAHDYSTDYITGESFIVTVKGQGYNKRLIDYSFAIRASQADGGTIHEQRIFNNVVTSIDGVAPVDYHPAIYISNGVIYLKISFPSAPVACYLKATVDYNLGENHGESFYFDENDLTYTQSDEDM